MHRVLIVEDESIIAMGLRHQLRALGLDTVAVAACARDALECMRRHCVELVFMDVMLSGRRDGIEAAEAIRGVREVPVIFMSAFTDGDTELRARRAGGVAFLSKPAEDSELAGVLRTIFGPLRGDGPVMDEAVSGHDGADVPV
ncbi:CheY-like chemotaxis protein [Desulfobaculum xiamenense]|uniref:CheY-like chemotaxis protein n=1 Tax=Desulfobaculum xiamenense TaxID=995050 RepID=A0A846QTD8_9BACT|nr:response regulator [Desulfobaculum xiamenense]NJB68735.1 CheY-like chemotaxis protein [Desulfobaculum xiamenense]